MNDLSEKPEDKQELLHRRISQLMARDAYYPFTERNLKEALREIDVGFLSKLFLDNRVMDVGTMMQLLVSDYWYTAARKEAEIQLRCEGLINGHD